MHYPDFRTMTCRFMSLIGAILAAYVGKGHRAARRIIMDYVRLGATVLRTYLHQRRSPLARDLPASKLSIAASIVPGRIIESSYRWNSSE
jgi:hypothetical protein